MNEINKAEAEMQAISRAENAEQHGKRQVWERMPAESPKAFHAFRLYRDAAEKRTLAKVAAELGCSSTNVERWARRWNWVNRCYEFDLVTEEHFREQTVRDRLAHHRRQIQIGQVCQSVAVAGLRELQDRLEQKLPLNLAPSEVAVLLKLGDEMETRGLGDEKEHGKFTRIVVNFCRLEDDPPEDAAAPPLLDAAEIEPN